jgi:hypothetical protein
MGDEQRVQPMGCKLVLNGALAAGVIHGKESNRIDEFTDWRIDQLKSCRLRMENERNSSIRKFFNSSIKAPASRCSGSKSEAPDLAGGFWLGD